MTKPMVDPDCPDCAGLGCNDIYGCVDPFEVLYGDEPPCLGCDGPDFHARLEECGPSSD